MLLNRNILPALFCFIFTQLFILKAQTTGDVRFTIDNQTDIRKVSQDYFGDPNLWIYILKYNNIKDLSSIQPGDRIIIPQKKVKEFLDLFDSASKSIEDAVKAGAKILSPELFDKSTNDYYEAVKLKEALDFDSSREHLIESMEYAKKAFDQTMEIREKTIDAIISYKKGTIQKMFPTILKWEDAELYDNLKENDWARTLSLSLANITFNDLSQIKLYENSEAVIRRSRVDVLGNKTDTKVKLGKGSAYAMLENDPKKKFDLDIEGVRTKINSKYFWIEKTEKNAKLANYNGEITLGVKDSSVIVRKDQGSVIPNGGYPSKPKNLIPAPVIISPADFSSAAGDNLKFKWENIPEASDYTLEISESNNFKNVDRSFNNINSESFQITGIKPGVYYWRVCSLDNLGLPGPFSEIRSLIVSNDSTKPFIDVDIPSGNLALHKNIFAVRGRTNPGCRVLINNTEVKTDGAGKFDLKLNLTDGKNIIEIESINSIGGKSKIERSVFVDANPDFDVTDMKFGKITDSSKFYTGGDLINLNLSTKPLSRLEIKSLITNLTKTTYTDSLGNCEVTMPLKFPTELFSLEVYTLSDYKKQITFEICKKSEHLDIVLDSSLGSFVNRRKINIRGKAPGAEELFINGNKIPLNANKEFNSLQTLNNLNNLFLIKAIDNSGNTKLVERMIICDDKPPELISSDLRKTAENQIRIIIKAKDETYLDKTAEVEISSKDKNITEILPLNPESGFYELTINGNELVNPQIKSITLKDCLNNKKNYQMRNKK